MQLAEKVSKKRKWKWSLKFPLFRNM
jgi:hypothetical protein